MTLLKNKRGMGLPAMLGLVFFLMASTATVLTFVVNDAFAVNRDVVNKTELSSAINAVDAAVNELKNMISKAEFIDENDILWNSFNVKVELITDGFRISRAVGSKTVVSYLSTSAGYLFNSTKSVLDDESLKTANLLDAYIDYKNGNQDDVVLTFDEQIDLLGQQYTNLAPANFPTSGEINQDYFITGNLNPQNNGNIQAINVAEGHVLVIDGDLIVDSNTFYINGTVIVRGDVILKNTVSVIGNMFVGGSFSAPNNFTLGIEGSISYLFVQGTININNNMDMYGYIISDTTVYINNNSSLSGGVYGHESEPSIAGNDPTPIDSQEVNDSEMGAIITYSTQSSGPTMSTRPQLQ